MRFILCYDIESDCKRARLVKILEDYGERIQYSVFEFKLSDACYLRMMDKIKKAGILDDKVCTLSIYPICEACYKKVERFGTNKLLNEDNIIL
jgi:CRISPR-associated protein Cas2